MSEHYTGPVFLCPEGMLNRSSDGWIPDWLPIRTPWRDGAWDDECEGGDEAAANTRRIAACWNACDGVSTEFLEHLATLHENEVESYENLLAQRDELLAALIRAERKLAAYVGVCSGDKELIDAVLPMARAAIAKAGVQP